VYLSNNVDVNELIKINICLQTLEVGANDKSAQQLENALKNEVHTNFLTEIWPFEDPTILYLKR
jgi:hypothetical protein